MEDRGDDSTDLYREGVGEEDDLSPEPRNSKFLSISQILEERVFQNEGGSTKKPAYKIFNAWFLHLASN